MSATLTPSSTVLLSTTLVTTAPSNPHVSATTTSHPPHSANYCTGCKHTDHMIYDCWHTGGEQEGSANHAKMVQAPIVNAFVTQQSFSFFFFFGSNLSPFGQSPMSDLTTQRVHYQGPSAFPNHHDSSSPTWQRGSLNCLLTFLTDVKFVF